MPRRPTIYDVAAAAGVSPSTVSRALSRPGRVSAATARHVLDVAKRLGYRAEGMLRPVPDPHLAAVGVVADLSHPATSPILVGAHAAATEAGYALVVADARQSERVERDGVTRLLPQVDALIDVRSRASDADLRALGAATPLVLIDRRVTGVASVTTDVARAARRAVEHLAGLGHRHLGYVAGPDSAYQDAVRRRHVADACFELGLTHTRVGPVAPTMEGGRRAARRLVDKGATAAIGYDDLVAVGLVRGLREAGRSVPEQVSVVGFDDLPVAAVISPALTTVAAPLTQMGEVAVRRAVAAADDARPNLAATTVPVRMVVRDSTAAPAS